MCKSEDRTCGPWLPHRNPEAGDYKIDKTEQAAEFRDGETPKPSKWVGEPLRFTRAGGLLIRSFKCE